MIIDDEKLGSIVLLEHHGEFFEGVLTDTRLVASLDLLFQIVLHAHTKLVQLIPLLSQPHSAANISNRFCNQIHYSLRNSKFKIQKLIKR